MPRRIDLPLASFITSVALPGSESAAPVARTGADSASACPRATAKSPGLATTSYGIGAFVHGAKNRRGCPKYVCVQVTAGTASATATNAATVACQYDRHRAEAWRDL